MSNKFIKELLDSVISTYPQSINLYHEIIN